MRSGSLSVNKVKVNAKSSELDGLTPTPPMLARSDGRKGPTTRALNGRPASSLHVLFVDAYPIKASAARNFSTMYRLKTAATAKN